MISKFIFSTLLSSCLAVGSAYAVISAPDVEEDCIGKPLQYYKDKTPKPFFLEVRKSTEEKAKLFEQVKVWRPKNAHLLKKNSEKFSDNKSPIIYHYTAEDENGNPLKIMLSYRVDESYIDPLKYEFANNESIKVTSYNDPLKKIGSTAKIKDSKKLKNTFGGLCTIQPKTENKENKEEEK